ncbi:MAG: nucleotidyltransferase family protein [Bacteroidales bacterium]|nr:nucleotidyltransferase family protein [Bacteroidales bacterium]
MLHNRAIILAAGSSRRMGTQKLLLPFRDRTIIETVIHNVMQSGVYGIVVVIGADHEKIRTVIDPLPVEVCFNEEFESGMLSSVRCGFSSMPEDTGTALVFLGDQPGIPPEVTDTIIKAYDESLHGIVIPVYDHRRGHPLLVDMKYKREIEKLDLEKGLRSLMHHFPEDVLEVEVDEPGILVDIDTREDYSNAN